MLSITFKTILKLDNRNWVESRSRDEVLKFRCLSKVCIMQVESMSFCKYQATLADEQIPGTLFPLSYLSSESLALNVNNQVLHKHSVATALTVDSMLQ